MPQGAGRTAEDGPRAAQRWVLLHPEVPRAAQAVVNANAVRKSSGGDPEGIAGGDLIIPTSAMSLFCSRWLVCEGLKALLEAAQSVPRVTEWGEKGGSLWGPEGEEERTTSNYHECNTQGEQIQCPSPNQVDATPYLAVETSRSSPSRGQCSLELGKRCTSSSAKAWSRLLSPSLVRARVPHLRSLKLFVCMSGVLLVGWCCGRWMLTWISRSSWEHSGSSWGVLQNWGQL